MNEQNRTLDGSSKEYLKVCQFQAIHFHDTKLDRQVIILYALTVDGVIREFTNGVWKGFPIPIEDGTRFS
jgi:hypothetical protein